MFSSQSHDGIFAVIYRYMKKSGLWLFLDVLLSFLFLVIVLVFFVTLAKADDIVWDGGDNGVPAAVAPNRQTARGFFPDASPSDNRVYVTRELNGYFFGGIASLAGLGEAEAARDWSSLGGQEDRVKIWLTPTGGYAYAKAPAGETSVLGTVARATDNYLLMDNVRLENGEFYGGLVEIVEGLGTGIASGNVVHVSGSSINPDAVEPEPAAGGVIFKQDAFGKGVANDNSLIMIGGEAQRVYGGFVSFNYGLGAQEAEASGNSVYLKDAQIATNVHGALIVVNQHDVARATGNTVTLAGATRVGRNLNGAYGQNSDVRGEFFAGNVLNIMEPAAGGIRVNNLLRNFETINFTFAANAPSGSVGLSLGQGAFLNDATSYADGEYHPSRGARIGAINLLSGDAPPEVGFELVLMEAPPLDQAGQQGIMADLFETESLAGAWGHNLVLEYGLTLTATELLAKVLKTSAHPQLDSTLDAPESSLVIVNRGLDLVAESALTQIAGQGQRADSSSGLNSPCPFASFSSMGSWDGYRSGGNLDVRGFFGLLGVGCARETSLGVLSLSLFAEGGTGSYRSQRKIAGSRDMAAKGDARFGGGGLAARLDFNHIRAGHFYGLMAFHAGTLKSDYESRDFEPAGGAGLSYDVRHGFAGAVAGGGFVFYRDDRTSLDLSSKYLWTRLGGATFRTNLGDEMTFNAATSQRVKVGLVFSRSLGYNLGFFLGAGIEREFDGVSEGSTYGRPLRPTTLRGNSATLEGGVNFRTWIGSPFAFSLSAQAHAGRRRGGGVLFSLNYGF
ncbi:MAG: hypothetical protein LBO66_00070 [Deltaproteobacteria bacterium]|jgi:hypothetical protein|nr:hypothetical protein [Deltaproteobacteria bacterium]